MGAHTEMQATERSDPLGLPIQAEHGESLTLDAEGRQGSLTIHLNAQRDSLGISAEAKQMIAGL